MSIKTETKLYEEIWSVDKYADHSPGETVAHVFMDCILYHQHPLRNCDVLDAGCGSGKGAIALSDFNFEVEMCDLTPNGLIPEARKFKFKNIDLTHLDECYYENQFDYVYCCDVLEHVPPQFTMLAIHQMLKLARCGLFISVALVPDNFGIWVGEPLHKTVQPFTWWKESISQIGNVLEARDLLVSAIFYVSAR